MENSKAFLDRDVVAICEYITDYCQKHICSSPSLNIQNIRSFYTFLPELLVCLFGSPNAKGFLQTNLQSHQDLALKKLLKIHNPFFQSLMKLSQYPDFSYDLSTESLPADVRKVLSTGAAHLLPKVYSNCTVATSSSTTNSIDIRTAATIQSNLLPNCLTSEMKIQFNMLQFYLYYFANIPTWASAQQQAITNTTSISNLNKQNGNQQMLSTKSFYPSSTALGSHATKTITSTLQNLTCSIYTEVLDEYLTFLIPISGHAFSAHVDRFFLDALTELWIRTPWISNNGRLNSTYMFYISHFVHYIVKSDLRSFVNESSTYEAVRDELYMLISRLALNWERADDYIQASVIELWCLWAGAWRRGAPVRSTEYEIYEPIERGWALFILDNIPYYFSMVNIFLEKIAMFSYTETAITGQLRILYRLINTLKAQGLISFLAAIEKALDLSSIDTTYAKELATLTGISELRVKEKISQANTRLAQLEGQRPPWKSKGLYGQDHTKRSPVLIQSLAKLREVISKHESGTWALSKKPSRHLQGLQEAYQTFSDLFHLQYHNHIQTSQTPSLSTPSTGLAKITYAGLQNGGFLTSEELQKIRDGKMVCAPNSIPAVGRRVQTVIRSYEHPTLVHWSFHLDKRLNEIVK
ncbi:hypothetical protein G6F37_005756 [Rhizopus arrhizus]|nr:hypothetical protein G6F38_003566 [Rhizopus arrhizus]KAG1158477.1 hypothetical protein G6F37_005756 [Rhizopus arrhizus]